MGGHPLPVGATPPAGPVRDVYTLTDDFLRETSEYVRCLAATGLDADQILTELMRNFSKLPDPVAVLAAVTLRAVWE